MGGGTRKDLGKIDSIFVESTRAQFDYNGVGINNFKLGRQITYKINDVIDWLINNVKLVNFDY